MNYLILKGISKSYGERTLFSAIEWYINKGDKCALIARNGTGKTSLLRIIVGEEKPDGDEWIRQMHQDARVGYLEQDTSMPDHLSIRQIIFDDSDEKLAALSTYLSLINDPHAGADDMQRASEAMDRLKLWNLEAQVNEILFKLGLQDLDLLFSALSGGQRKRLVLAKVLISEPDFLILDEPTNHLDIDMIEWLEKYLSKANLTLLLITHDRYFMDRICDQIYELDHGQLFKYTGNYADYLEKKSIQEYAAQQAYEKNKKRYKSELEWIRRQPKARTTKAKSRIDRFEDIRSEVYAQRQDGELILTIQPDRLGSKIMEIQYINLSYGDKVMFKDFHYKFNKKDRIGIIGPNGTGKTTLVNLMTEHLKPDSGQVVVGSTVKFGYYTQHGITLDHDRRVIDIVRDIAEFIPMEKGRKLTAEKLLENFLFDRAQQQVYVSRLSGGEKRRLHLLTILMQNPNFLILDEPTNDLDIYTLQILEDYLIDYPGVLVIVSHDRFFMDKLVDHLFVLEGEGVVSDFPGNYSAYKSNKSASAKSTTKIVEEIEPTDQSTITISYEDRKKIKNKLRHIERQLADLNDEKDRINQRFLDNEVAAEEVATVSARLNSIDQTMEGLEVEWLDLSELVDD